MSNNKFSEAQFFGQDFDGTIADTLKNPAWGYGVEAATNIAIGDTLKVTDIGKLRDQGGLQNRAPLEIIQLLRPKLNPEEQQLLCNKLVEAKLEVLMNQISFTWPEPMPGYITFIEILRKKQDAGEPINDIVISSGHKKFITKTFETTFGIKPPKIILAQEAIQRTATKYGEAMPVKPSPRLMVYAYNRWREQHSLPGLDEINPDDLPRMRYIGDDPIKDGQMAEVSGVQYYQINPDTSKQTWEHLSKIVQNRL